MQSRPKAAVWIGLWRLVENPFVWLAGGTLLLAFALRFYHLGFKGLWGDEIYQARQSVRPLEVLWARHGGDDFLLQFALVQLAERFGANEWFVRLPSALASVLLVPVSFLIGRRWYGRAAGLTVMLLASLAPFQIWYAQDARMYAGQCFFAALSLYFFLRLLDKPDGWGILGLTLANSLGLWNHLFAAFPIAVETLCILILAARARLVANGRGASPAGPAELRPLPALSPFLFSLALTAVLALPLAPVALPFLVTQSANALPTASAARPRLDPAYLAQLLSLYGMSADWSWRAWTSLLFAGVGLTALYRAHRPAALIALLWIGLPLLTLYLINPSYNLAPRYLIFMQPVYLTLIAIGLLAVARTVPVLLARVSGERRTTTTRGWWHALAGLGLAVWLGAAAVPVLQGLYARAKINDWASIAAYIQRHAEPGDLIYGEKGTWVLNALEHYLPSRRIMYRSTGSDLGAMEVSRRARERFWYLSVGGGADPPSEEWARAHLAQVDALAWERPELVYRAGAPFLFPQSEGYAYLYFSDGALPSDIRYRQETESGETDFLNVKRGETLDAKLAPAISRPAYLQIEYRSQAGTQFQLSANGQIIGGDGAGPEGWKTGKWALPEGASDPVLVQLRNVGTNPLSVRRIRLLGATGAP